MADNLALIDWHHMLSSTLNSGVVSYILPVGSEKSVEVQIHIVPS
jgi:hypothetical protein